MQALSPLPRSAQDRFASLVRWSHTGMTDQLPTEIAHGRAGDLIGEAMKNAIVEGIPHDQILLALADMVSSFAWKLGGEAKLLVMLVRIEATIDILNGKRLPMQSETKN
jgi:hypothetical protein